MTTTRQAGINVVAAVAAYLFVALLAALIAFDLGVADFERRECSEPDFDGECDVSMIQGMAWAVYAVVLTTAVAFAGLVAAWASRRARR